MQAPGTRMRDIFLSLVVAALLSLIACDGRQSAVPPALQVIPTPKQVHYGKTFVPVVDLATKTNTLRIQLDPEGSRALRFGIRELRAELVRRSGGSLERSDASRVVWLRVVALSSWQGDPASLLGRGSPARGRSEGYSLRFAATDSGWIIEVAGTDERGAYWGLQTLRQLLTERAGSLGFRTAEIDDWPTFRIRAFKSQAFEGEMWSMADAIRAARWAPSVKFNAFSPCYTHLSDFYRPSASYLAFLDSLLAYADSTGVLEIIPEVNPYYGRTVIATSNPHHVAALTDLLARALRGGAQRLMLQLDDFARLPEQDKRAYEDLAEANADLIGRLRDSLLRVKPDHELWVCTPVYFYPRNEEEHRYLHRLATLAPRDVDIVWTGRVVTTLCQSREDIEAYRELVGGRRLVYWDNTLKQPPGWGNIFRCNAFMAACDSPMVYDWQALAEATERRFLCNTYAPSELTKISLATVADFLWNPEAYDRQTSLRRAAAHYDPEDPQLGMLVVQFANFWHDRAHRLYEELCRTPSDSVLHELEAAVDSLARGYQVISARTRNRVLVEQIRPYVERYTLALPHLRRLVAASKLPPADFAEKLQTEIIPGLEAVRHRVLKKKGEGEFRSGVFAKGAVEDRNLDALRDLLAQLRSKETSPHSN